MALECSCNRRSWLDDVVRGERLAVGVVCGAKGGAADGAGVGGECLASAGNGRL